MCGCDAPGTHMHCTDNQSHIHKHIGRLNIQKKDVLSMFISSFSCVTDSIERGIKSNLFFHS